ncbi:MAG TPA: YciI family protein [Thermoanaerobaculia bacterium]|jgi:hypothetical protein
MRFMTIVKSEEKFGFPPQELIDAIEELRQEGIKSGVFLDTGGLAPTATGAAVRLRGGKLSVVDGPFTESKEVVGGYAVFELPSQKEAIEWSRRFMELHRKHWPAWEGVTEIRQLFTPEDLCVEPEKRWQAEAHQ